MEELKPILESHSLTPGQLALLASEPQRAIVELLAGEAALSRHEIARRLGRPATSVHYQLDRLRQAGLVVERGRRTTDRRPELLYGLVARRLVSSGAAESAEGRRALAASGRRIIAAVARAFARAVEGGAAPLDGPGRRAALRRQVLRLDARGLAALNAAIERLTADLPDPASDGEKVTLTIILS